MDERHTVASFVVMLGAGRGIVAARSIQAMSTIEICPVLVLPFEDLDVVKSTALFHYTW